MVQSSKSNYNTRLPGSEERPPDKYQALIDGRLSVDDLDDDEIIRGQLRDKNGRFSGRPPLVIPRALHQKAVEELKRRADNALLEHLGDAQMAIVDVMNNKRAPAMARVEAAKYMWERIQGKIPDKVQVDSTVRVFEELVDAGAIVVDIDVEDAEIVEETDGPQEEHHRFKELMAGAGVEDGDIQAYEVAPGDDGAPVVRRKRRRRES